MAIKVYDGKGNQLTKATIAIMRQQKADEQARKSAPDWNGKHNGRNLKSDGLAAKNSTKLSHSQRKARIVANSMAADPKKNAGFKAGVVRK